MARSMQELAREALDVQKIADLSWVAVSFPRALRELKRLMPPDGRFGIAYDDHPITYMWVDRIADLTSQNDMSDRAIDRYLEMRGACEAIARGEPSPYDPLPAGWDEADD